MEDVNYLMGHGTEDAYLFTVHSSRRNLEVYPDPNEYVINFDNPFRNVVGLEVVQALLPRSQYMVDTHNHLLVLYVAETRYAITVPVGEYTHETLRDALNQELNPIGVSASFQDRGRNVFQLHSDRVLKVDVLGSTMTRLLGFNTDAEYPELEYDRTHGSSVETNLVDHAWNFHPEQSPPWPDIVTGNTTWSFIQEDGTDFATTESFFHDPMYAQKSVAFSYRSTHGTYTSSSFRIPKWQTLCQTPTGYDVDIGTGGDVRVRRYHEFQTDLARTAVLIPLEPSILPLSDSVEDFQTILHFPFTRGLWMDTMGTHQIVSNNRNTIQDETLVQSLEQTWKGGMVLAHYDREDYLDVRTKDSDEVPVFVQHVNPETNLVDHQAYLVSTLHYHTTRGNVPVFRYGAHPDDAEHTGYIEVQLDHGDLVSERYVEEKADQMVSIPLVSSSHDTSEPGGFTEPRIERNGQRYSSTVSNEYTFSLYVSETEWKEAAVDTNGFHRVIWMGTSWKAQVISVHDDADQEDILRLQVGIYDTDRSMTDTVLRYGRKLQELGNGWVRRLEDPTTQIENGVYKWMIECWILILRIANGGSLDEELEETIRDLVANEMVHLIQRKHQDLEIEPEDWDDLRQKVVDMKENLSHLPTIPVWDEEVEAWIRIAEQRSQGNTNLETLDTSLKHLIESVGLYGYYPKNTWAPLILKWVIIFEATMRDMLEPSLIVLLERVILDGVADFIEQLVGRRTIPQQRWLEWQEEVQHLLDQTSVIDDTASWYTEWTSILQEWIEIANPNPENGGLRGTTDYPYLLETLFRLRQQVDLSSPTYEGRGIPGGGALAVLDVDERIVRHVLPFESPSVVSILSIPVDNMEEARFVDTITIDGVPCFGLTLTTPVNLRNQRTWFRRGDTEPQPLPEFDSNQQIRTNETWSSSNAWIVDASSTSDGNVFQAINTKATSLTKGWTSECRTSPAEFPVVEGTSHSNLFYWRRPSEKFVRKVHGLFDRTKPIGPQAFELALAIEEFPQEKYEAYTTMGNQWNVGLGGRNGIVVRGDSRLPGFFACRIALPPTIDSLYNTIICSIGGETNAMGVGIDAEGYLFGRCGNGRSLDPSETSYVRVDPHRIPNFLNDVGWLSWFLIPSAFGVQISLYWNGIPIGRGSRTSSRVTQWSDSDGGTYLTPTNADPIVPWSPQTPHWLRLHNTEHPLTIRQYTVQTIQNVPFSEYTFPMEFQLQVSNDNIRWKTIDERSVENWIPGEERTFQINDEGVYWYVRLHISKSNHSYVSLGKWNMKVIPAILEEQSNHFEVPMVLFGTSSLQTVDNLTAGDHPKIPRVSLTWEGTAYPGFVGQFQPISETGVSIESRVYVYQNQNPKGLIQRGDTLQVRTVPFDLEDPNAIDLECRVQRVIHNQGTHPETGEVTDGIDWFVRMDGPDAVFRNYIENMLVGRGEIRIRRTVSTQRIDRRVLYPRLKDGHRYTLSLRLLPDGTLRYIVLDGDDLTEYTSRYYTIDPIPVMGLLDGQSTGRMSGFEKASLTFPQRGFSVNENETYALLQDILWSYQEKRVETDDTLFMPYEEYEIEQRGPDGTVQRLDVHVPKVPDKWEESFPSRIFHGYDNSTEEERVWVFSTNEDETQRWHTIGMVLEGQGLDSFSFEHLHVLVEGGVELEIEPVSVTPKFIHVQQKHASYTGGPPKAFGPDIRVQITEKQDSPFRVWNVGIITYDANDKRTCYYQYDITTLPQQVQNAVLCTHEGAVHMIDGEENRVQVLFPPSSISGVPLHREQFRVCLPQYEPDRTMYLQRLEVGESLYMQSTFFDSFRYLEESVYMYSTPVRQGGTFIRELIPSVTDKLVTVDAFRWIQYFTLGEDDLDDTSLHTVTLFFPDASLFDRSLPLTFTLRDDGSRVLDEFTTFWDRGTDTQGRVVSTSFEKDVIGPFTQLSSIQIAYDKFRTSTDIRLKKGVRYSLMVSTLDVLVMGTNDTVTDLDRVFPLRVAYIPSRGSMKGFVATYGEDTRAPEWIDGFVPLRLKLTNVENRVVSPGITTLSPDSFLKLSIPEIEQHVFVHRNYDQWTGGIATFFLSPGLDHKEFNEHMHVGLIKRFFPIGRLDQMTIRFLSEDNRPYNFRGVNHVLRLVLRFLVPKWNPMAESILAPHYDPSQYGSYQKRVSTQTDRDSVDSSYSSQLEYPSSNSTTLAPVWNEIKNPPLKQQSPEEWIKVMKTYAKVLREAGTILDAIPEDSSE